jgi:hypothetical protein
LKGPNLGVEQQKPTLQKTESKPMEGSDVKKVILPNLETLPVPGTGMLCHCEYKSWYLYFPPYGFLKKQCTRNITATLKCSSDSNACVSLLKIETNWLKVILNYEKWKHFHTFEYKSFNQQLVISHTFMETSISQIHDTFVINIRLYFNVICDRNGLKL